MPCPFETWAALQAAADAGDAEAAAFLRMYEPWVRARLAEQPRA